MNARTWRRVAVVQGRANELQRCGPALGAATELGEHRRLDADVVGVAEELLGLGGVEAEVVGVELGDLALGAQAGQADRRLAPGGEDERHAIRAAMRGARG